MLNGWSGLELEIDLSTGNIQKKESDTDIYRAFMGGRGVGSKVLWDRVAPEVDPWSPDNLLIINPGTLVGTICPAANRTTVHTRSPQNNLMTYGLLGGFWGAELKLAGYDQLILAGKADRLVYILIVDGRVEIRDASHLAGKDVFETQKLIRSELQDNDVQIICIGPAGENKVMCASVEHATGSSISRGGVGAVFGDKRVKAVAVRGTRDVRIARPREFGDLCDRIIMESGPQKAWTDDTSHYEIANLARNAQTGNLESGLLNWEVGDEHAAFLHDTHTKRSGCFNCQFGCRKGIKVPGAGKAYLKCVTHVTYATTFKILDFNFNLRAYEIVERMGMDTMSVVMLGAFAIDLFNKGILTLADTDGLHLEFGNEQLALKLIEMIARREGIGDVLANGIVPAARHFGRGAEQYAHNLKGLEVLNYPSQKPYIAYTAAVADRADSTRLISYVPQHLFLRPREFVEWYIQSQYWQYPNDWKKYCLEPYDPAGADVERMSLMIARDRDDINISDNLGVCTWWTDFRPYSPATIERIVELFSHATGMDVDFDHALKMAARSGALIRSYNAILGIRRKDDTVPEKSFHEPAPPKYGPLSRANFDNFVSEYYRLRGWNADGIPTRENLASLDLQYVADNLQARGLYDQPSNGKEGGERDIVPDNAPGQG